MAESSKTFKVYHYQQVKCETKTKVNQYMRMTRRYSSEKGKGFQNNMEQIDPQQKSDPYPWLADDDPRRYQSDEEIILFKILDDGEGNLDTVLCIRTSKVHDLLNAYHSSILGGHTGITKCYHTITQRFYCPNLAENLRAYITGCHMCHMFQKGKDFKRPYQKRINLNVPAMTKISMDIKQMPVNKGYSHILALLCEVTNYMVTLTLMSTRTPHI